MSNVTCHVSNVKCPHPWQWLSGCTRLVMSFTRIKAIRRDAGMGGLVLFALKKLLRPVMDFGTLVFFECDLRKPFPTAPPNKGFVAREAFRPDLELLAALENGEQYRLTAGQRLNNGERWFVGIEARTGELANYRWMTERTGYIPEISRYLMLRPGEVYIYDLFTLPRYRRHGVDAFVRHSVYRSLAAAGVVKIHAYIRGSNYPSLKAARLLLWYVTLFGRAFTLVSRKSHFPPLRKNPGSRGRNRCESTFPSRAPALQDQGSKRAQQHP